MSAELLLRRGRGSAIQIRDLTRKTGLSERDIKQAVEGLIVRHRLLIGSSRRPPYGYFMIETAAELETTCRTLKNQAIAELRRIYALQGKDRVRLRELLGQMEMEVAAWGAQMNSS